jgi:hypothetical protein
VLANPREDRRGSTLENPCLVSSVSLAMMMRPSLNLISSDKGTNLAPGLLTSPCLPLTAEQSLRADQRHVEAGGRGAVNVSKRDAACCSSSSGLSLSVASQAPSPADRVELI